MLLCFRIFSWNFFLFPSSLFYFDTKHMVELHFVWKPGWSENDTGFPPAPTSAWVSNEAESTDLEPNVSLFPWPFWAQQ